MLFGGFGFLFACLFVLMISLVWNCQGVGSRAFIRTALFFIKTYKPDIMALVETNILGERATETCKKIKFDNWFRIEVIRFSRGIWIFCKKDVDVRVVHTHPQFAVLEVNNSNKTWNMVIVYGSPYYQLRNRLWNDLNQGHLSLYKEWLVAGDFNSGTNNEEVSTPDTFNQ